MSAKLLKTLTASHLNSLNSTIGSLETQVAALKTVLTELKGSKADAEESEEEEADEKPAPKKAAKKAKPVVEDEEEELSDDESEDDANEADEAPAKSKFTVKDVVKALQAFAVENDRAASIKVLKKFGVNSVHDLEPSQYGKIMTALEI